MEKMYGHCLAPRPIPRFQCALKQPGSLRTRLFSVNMQWVFSNTLQEVEIVHQLITNQCCSSCKHAYICTLIVHSIGLYSIIHVIHVSLSSRSPRGNHLSALSIYQVHPDPKRQSHKGV